MKLIILIKSMIIWIFNNKGKSLKAIKYGLVLANMIAKTTKSRHDDVFCRKTKELTDELTKVFEDKTKELPDTVKKDIAKRITHDTGLGVDLIGEYSRDKGITISLSKKI